MENQRTKVEGKLLVKGRRFESNAILITKNKTFRFRDFPNLNYLIEEDTKMLRETLSYMMYQDDFKTFEPEEFYFDKWDLRENTVGLDEFLKRVKNYKGKYRIFEERGNYLLFISEAEFVDRGNYQYQNEAYHIDDTEIFAYECDDSEKLMLLKKLCEKDVNTAIIKCVLTSFDYKKNEEDMYDHFKLKTGKKIRDIHAPKEDVKESLRHLLVALSPSFDNRKRKTNQFAYVSKKSIKDNVELHKKNKYVVKTDITAFFDYCSRELVFKYLKPILVDKRYSKRKYSDFKYSLDFIELFEEITEYLDPMIINPETDGLYMGSPVSGVLSNLIMKPVTLYLQNIFKKKGMTISVYADDITVSSNEPINPKYVTDTINYVFDFYDLPFELKEEKTKYLKNNGRRITGVRINHKDEMTIDRIKYKLMRSLLDNLSKGKPVTMNHSQIEGRLNYYIFIDESGKFKKLCYKYIETLVRENINVKLEPQLQFPV